MPIINQVVKGGGGSAPASYLEYNIDANGEVTKWTNLSTLGNQFKIIGEKTFWNLLYRDSQITSVDFSNVEVIKQDGLHSFCAASVLTSLNLSSLVSTGYGAMSEMARSNSNPFTTLIVPSLKYIESGCFDSAFRGANGFQLLNLPALYIIKSNSFTNMLMGVTGCTIHFPKNLDPQGGSTVISSLSGYPNFSGTNTVLVFDLPSTNHLIGADTIEYERNPKYDTATALGWRKKDAGTDAAPVIDWTPYYTSGTTDPQVGDTIYSDDACTTAVTTISSIA